MLRDITPLQIAEFLEGLDGRSATTRRLLYALLCVIFDLAVEYDLIERSPVRKKLHKPEVTTAEKPILTTGRIRAILGQREEPYRRFALLLAVTGMQVGEALALRPPRL